MKGPSLKVFSFTNPPGFFGSGRTPMPAGEEGRNASETLQKRPISGTRRRRRRRSRGSGSRSRGSRSRQQVPEEIRRGPHGA